MNQGKLAKVLEDHLLLRSIRHYQSVQIKDGVLCSAVNCNHVEFCNISSLDTDRKSFSTFKSGDELRIKMNKYNSLVVICHLANQIHVKTLETSPNLYQNPITSCFYLSRIKVFQVGFNDSIVFFDWHPSSLYSDHLLILTKLGKLLMYRIIDGNANLEFELSIRSKTTLQYNCVDATFLDSFDDWDWATLLVLLDNGDVIQICPLIPLPSKIPLASNLKIEPSLVLENHLVITKNPFNFTPEPSKPFLIQPEPVEINSNFTFIENFSYEGLIFVLIGWGNHRIDLCLLSTKPNPQFEETSEDPLMILLESIEFPKGPATSKMFIKKHIQDSFLLTFPGLKQSFKLSFPWLESFGHSTIKSRITPLLKTPIDHLDVLTLPDLAAGSILYIFPCSNGKPFIMSERCESQSDRESFKFNFDKSITQTQLEKCMDIDGSVRTDDQVTIPVGYSADQLSNCKLPYDITEDKFEALLKTADDIRCSSFTKLTGAAQDLQTKLDYIANESENQNDRLDSIETRLQSFRDRQEEGLEASLESAKEKGKELRRRFFDLMNRFDNLLKTYQNSGSAFSIDHANALIHRISLINEKLSKYSRPSFPQKPKPTFTIIAPPKVDIPLPHALQHLSLALSKLSTR